MTGHKHATGLRCPDGHSGPFRYVEAIEVWRNVVTASKSELQVDAYWQTGDGYWDGVTGSEYLQCHHDTCLEKFPLPDGAVIDWL